MWLRYKHNIDVFSLNHVPYSLCSLPVSISLFHSLTHSLSLTLSLRLARYLSLTRTPSLPLPPHSLSTSGFLLLLRTSYPHTTKNGQVMEGGVDGVVVALGGRTTEVGTRMLTDGTRNIIEAMKVCGHI